MPSRSPSARCWLRSPIQSGISLLGATGLTGRHVLELALREGYEVTVLVRDAGVVHLEGCGPSTGAGREEQGHGGEEAQRGER